MKNILFIAWQDVRNQLRQGSTLLWVFVMPPIFFFFIGTVTGGFSSGLGGGQGTPLTVVAESPGFLKDQIDLRLATNQFEAEWVESLELTDEEAAPTRTLTFDTNMSDKVLAEEQVKASFETGANALTREFEEIRINRALYTVLADIVIADATTGPLSAEALTALNDAPRVWQLDVSPAGERLEIPSGFQQAVPGILVMFTLLVLLTSSSTILVQERTQGLLRRLASTPISKAEVIAGKWDGRMVLAAIQILVALIFGTYLFKMNWGPNLGMVILVLVAWGGLVGNRSQHASAGGRPRRSRSKWTCGTWRLLVAHRSHARVDAVRAEAGTYRLDDGRVAQAHQFPGGTGVRHSEHCNVGRRDRCFRLAGGAPLPLRVAGLPSNDIKDRTCWNN